MVIPKNGHIAPYWGKGKEIKMGLNQLGMRTIVESLFATLLPGMNNVSSRIRYYSFYCWLIKQYRETGMGKDGRYHKEDFITFLRKSEYLLAIINYYSTNAQGIPGITYVINHIDSEPELINLSSGIITQDGSYRGSYWANKWGILGQYYSSSIVDLALIAQTEADKDFFNVTSPGDGFVDGDTIANAFAQAVGSEGDYFIDCVTKSSVTKEDAIRLSNVFGMHNYLESSKEQELTIRCLLQKDRPAHNNASSIHRRLTILYVLEYTQQNPDKAFDDQAFALWMYEKFHNTINPDTTVIGWYAYYLEECWQYLSSVAFNGILKNINYNEWISVADVVDTLAAEICGYITGDAIPNATLLDVVKNITYETKTTSPGPAYKQLLYLYAENKNHLDAASKHPAFSLLYTGNPDDVFAYFKVIDDNLEKDFKSFVKEYLTEKIIYRHYQIAFVKQRQTGIASQKFIMERGCIKKVMDYDFSHTSPRLGTLIGFLQDLGAIDGYNLTKIGLDIINGKYDEN